MASAPPEEADTCGAPAVPFEQALRPKVKRCFFKARAKKPDMTGHVRVTLRIDVKGHVKKIEVANPKDPKDLSAEAVACMKKVATDAHFDGSKCPGKAVIMNMAFGAAARE